MPWCDACDRLVEDSTVIDGACPTCGTQIVDTQQGPMPWKFRFMIAATAVYLIWRAWQLIMWLSH